MQLRQVVLEKSGSSLSRLSANRPSLIKNFNRLRIFMPTAASESRSGCAGRPVMRANDKQSDRAASRTIAPPYGSYMENECNTTVPFLHATRELTQTERKALN